MIGGRWYDLFVLHPGHASQEDIRIMTEAVRPKFVVPIHGEYRMLFRHKEFVKNHLGYAEENIILIENGDVLELDGERAEVVNKREIGRTFIDETGFEEIRRDTVRERRQMANDGMVTLVVTINSKTGELQAPPEIVARGVHGLDAINGFTDDARRIVTASITGASRDTLADESLLKEHIRVELKRFIQKRTGGRPVIMPVIAPSLIRENFQMSETVAEPSVAELLRETRVRGGARNLCRDWRATPGLAALARESGTEPARRCAFHDPARRVRSDAGDRGRRLAPDSSRAARCESREWLSADNARYRIAVGPRLVIWRV